MGKSINLIEKFDQLDSVEPSAGWEEKVLLKINGPRKKDKDFSGIRLFFLAMILLLAFNIFSISKSWLNERTQQNRTNLMCIASEYLITTNSSKF